MFQLAHKEVKSEGAFVHKTLLSKRSKPSVASTSAEFAFKSIKIFSKLSRAKPVVGSPRRRLRARSRQGGPGSDKRPFGDRAPSCTEWLHVFAAQVYRLPRSKNKQVCLRSCRDACVVGGSRRDPKHVRWSHALDPQTRSFMEERFRTDSGKVRIHTGLQAARLSSNLNAIAFTVENNIMFAEGKYSPDSQAGRQLLAHELTHVVQQQGAELHSLQRAKTYTTNSCSGLADSTSDVNSRINKALANAHKAAGASLPAQMWHRNFMQSWLKIPLRAQGEDRAMGRGIGCIKSAPSGPKFNQVCSMTYRL